MDFGNDRRGTAIGRPGSGLITAVVRLDVFLEDRSVPSRHFSPNSGPAGLLVRPCPRSRRRVASAQDSGVGETK